MLFYKDTLSKKYVSMAPASRGWFHKSWAHGLNHTYSSILRPTTYAQLLRSYFSKKFGTGRKAVYEIRPRFQIFGNKPSPMHQNFRILVNWPLFTGQLNTEDYGTFTDVILLIRGIQVAPPM